MFKKVIATVLALAMCLSMSVTAFARELRFEIDNPVYTVNGEERESADGVAPFISEGRTMLPLRTVAEALGGVVSFDEETRIATITRNDVVLNIAIGEELPGEMGVPEIVDGRILVPLAYVARELGVMTNWDEEARAVYVTAPAVQPVPDTGVANALDVNAYELLNLANEVLMEAGSVLMSMETAVTTEFLGETMDMQMLGTIAQVIRSETDIDMRMEMTTYMDGESMDSLVYFRDGVMYMNVDGDWIYMTVPLEDLMAQTGVVSFPEDAIISQQAIGRGDDIELRFIISGDAMTNLANVALGGIGETGLADLDISIGNVNVTTVVDSDGVMRYMDMHLNMVMNIEGLSVTQSMAMRSEVVQLGGITINFPQDLYNAVSIEDYTEALISEVDAAIEAAEAAIEAVEAAMEAMGDNTED